MAAASACSAPGPLSGHPPQPSLVGTTSVTVSVRQLDDRAFCQAARDAGITNTALMAGGAEPTTMLAALDQLVPSAPPEIHDDFTTFVALEHVVLDPTHGGSSAQLNRPATRDSLARVSDYLQNTCHIP